MATAEALRGRRRAQERFLEAVREVGLEERRRALLGLPEAVRPDLIPSERDRVETQRAIRKAARLADRCRRGSSRREELMREVIGRAAIGVYVERVLALDPLARAALTPGDLYELSDVSWRDVRELLGLAS